MATILENDLVQKILLPWVLIFTLVFAILQKTEVLGKGKQQIDAIVAFVIATIFVTFASQVDWVAKLSVFLAVGLFIIFAFLMLWGFVWGKSGDILGEKAEGLKWTIGIVALLAIVGFFLVITGIWAKLVSSPGFSSNLLFIILIVAVIVVVLTTGPKADKKDEKKT